jgi:DNA-binding IclR family transcriptional regulator
MSTSSVAASTALPRSTAHRLLSALQTQGIVDRDNVSGRWILGPELFLLSAAAAPRYDIREIAYPEVRKLAELTEESAFFSVRRGEETVCLIREDGAFPIRSHVLFEGVRFPLGVVSAGLAVLAYLPDQQIDAYLESANLAGRYGPSHASDAVRSRLVETRRTGWSVNPGLIVEGSWGMAAAVFDRNDRPIAALTLTGIAARFDPDRQREVGPLLLRTAHSLSRKLQKRSEYAS